jgi:hypothetical protein
MENCVSRSTMPVCATFAGDVEQTDLSPASFYLLDDLAERTRHAHQRIVDYYREQCDGDWPHAR